ncbi:hypothetical protein BGZ90_006061, partial [Linnemannia elongata]
MSVPGYDFPCLVQSTADPSTATKFYLIGSIQVERLDFSSVDLSDINNPDCQPITSDSDSNWSPSSAKQCFNYAGDSVGVAAPLKIHVQQFSPQKTFDLNALPYANGTIKFETTRSLRTVSLLSPKQFAIVGRTGSLLYGSGEKVDGSWGGLTVNSTTPNIFWKPSTAPPYGSFGEVSLVVGTFNKAVVPPVRGNLIAFYANGTSGSIFTTTGVDDLSVQVNDPQTIQMTDIKLTNDAIAVHMDTTAFILDK